MIKKVEKNPIRLPLATSVDGLRIRHLSSVYESAQEMTTLIPIDQLSTVDQLNRHMKEMLRDREAMILFFRCLEHLRKSTTVLGDVTLVQPADHPLTIRHTLPKEVKEK